MEISGVDMARCPLRLGSPLKVPSTAWDAWGIGSSSAREFADLVAESELCYVREWQHTDDAGLRDIAEAGRRAGLADCNAMLNAAVAGELLRVVAELPAEAKVLDIGAGAGATTLSVLDRLRNLAREMTFHLLEPAARSLKQAQSKLENGRFDACAGRFAFHEAKDLDLGGLFLEGTCDAVVTTAVMHHHAFIDPVLQQIAHVLKSGGVLIVGDWHNSMWLHPGRIYAFMSELNWEGKDADLAAFRVRFPADAPPETDPGLARANDQIRAFWRAYADVRTPGAPPYEMLEGHRPPAEYRLAMEKAGLRPMGPERLLLEGSALLGVHVARKP